MFECTDLETNDVNDLLYLCFNAGQMSQGDVAGRYRSKMSQDGVASHL